MATWPPTSQGWSLPIATEYAKEAVSTETTTGPLTAVQVAAAPAPTPAATSAANPRSCRAIVFTTYRRAEAREAPERDCPPLGCVHPPG